MFSTTEHFVGYSRSGSRSKYKSAPKQKIILVSSSKKSQKKNNSCNYSSNLSSNILIGGGKEFLHQPQERMLVNPRKINSNFLQIGGIFSSRDQDRQCISQLGTASLILERRASCPMSLYSEQNSQEFKQFQQICSNRLVLQHPSPTTTPNLNQPQTPIAKLEEVYLMSQASTNVTANTPPYNFFRDFRKKN